MIVLVSSSFNKNLLQDNIKTSLQNILKDNFKGSIQKKVKF